jgi:hypothetical protein
MNGTLPLFPDGRAASNAEGADESDEERAKRIVAALSGGLATSEEVFEAFAALDSLDSKAVIEALRPWTGEASDPESLDDELRRAHGFPPRRPRLRTRSIVRDADVLDLGDVAEEQLRLAGKSYDGRDLLAEERLDGEVEGSFAGTLEVHTLVDEGAPDDARDVPRFEVYFFAGDAGAIFRAGTTEIVGGISYGAVEMKDRVLREAITAALAAGIREPTQKAPAAGREHVVDHAAEVEAASAQTTKVTTTKASAKKASAKKATAEKAPVKKATATKTTAEKAPAKKASAKKTTAEKTPVKKATAAKAPVKKATVKKTTAKKATAEKASAKKSAGTTKTTAEKAPAKKAPAKKTTAKKTTAKKRAAS